MSDETYYPAHLSKDGLAALQVLEKELGRTIVAYAKSPTPAKLTDAQVDQLKSMESNLHATLIAY